MKANQQQVTKDEAKAALEALSEYKRSAIESVTPPLWYSGISSISYGMLIYAYSAMRHENLWALGLIASLACFFLVHIIAYRSYRLMGIRLKLCPSNKNGQIFTVVIAAIFGFLFYISRELSVMGYDWGAMVSALCAGLLMFFLMHRYPTGEFASKDDG